MIDQLSSRSALGSRPDLALRTSVAIGSATLDPRLREMRGGGATVRLEPRAVQVLLVLADAAGRTVTRNALFQECWNGAIVDESALNRVISQIRRAAIQTGYPYTVHTVTKHGYWLEPRIELAKLTADSTSDKPGTSRRGLLVAGGAVAVAATGLTWLTWRAGGRSGEAAELERRAALALADMLPARDAEAIAMLTEAAALDPQQPAIWGTLALAHQRAVESGPASGFTASVARTRSAARQALALDPDNANALVALALIAPVYRNWLAAEQTYQALGARFPTHVPLLAGHSKLLAEVGRFDDAMSLFDRIFAIEPLAPAWHWRRGMGLWAANRPGESLQLLEKAFRIWPAHPSVWAATFWVSAYTGALQRARALISTPIGQSIPQSQRDFMMRSVEALDVSDPVRRQEVLAANRKSAAASTTIAEHAMAVAALLGDAGEALAIARAYHFGEGFAIQEARLEVGTNMRPDRRKTLPLFWPPMARVREQAGFRELIHRLGLPKYWAASNTRPDHARG